MRPDYIPVAAIPLPLLQLDHEARIVHANILAQEALGVSERKLRGRALTDVFAPAAEIDKLMARLSPDSSVSDHQIVIRSSRMPISLHMCSVEGGMTAVFVPEAHRVEVDEHSKRHEMAEAVARIALEMAHEVKNPLAALRGAAQWLSEQPLSDSNHEAVTQMLSGVDRIRDRIDNFLQVGPRAQVKMQMVNVHTLIQGVIQHPDDIHVRRVFDPSLPETLVHPERLSQALENLWQNAVEAADNHIEWQTRMAPLVHLPGHHGQVIEISITNDGQMIPPELQARLFEPYVTGKKRGSGLGLALVERVMLEHGGRVNVKSDNGRTTFTLHLPVRTEQDEQTDNKEQGA